jgi:hypothetical protein
VTPTAWFRPEPCDAGYGGLPRRSKHRTESTTTYPLVRLDDRRPQGRLRNLHRGRRGADRPWVPAIPHRVRAADQWRVPRVVAVGEKGLCESPGGPSRMKIGRCRRVFVRYPAKPG